MTAQGNADYFLTKFDKTGTALWARTAGSGAAAYTERGYGVAVDNLGNIITSGECMRTTTFQGGANPPVTYTCLGINTDGFVAKYNSSGDLLWARFQADFQQEYTTSVAVDPSNNVVCVGYFGTSGYDTLKLPDQVFTSHVYGTNSRDWYVVKYDPNGLVLWGKTAGTAVTMINLGVLLPMHPVISMSVDKVSGIRSLLVVLLFTLIQLGILLGLRKQRLLI